MKRFITVLMVALVAVIAAMSMGVDSASAAPPPPTAFSCSVLSVDTSSSNVLNFETSSSKDELADVGFSSTCNQTYFTTAVLEVEQGGSYNVVSPDVQFGSSGLCWNGDNNSDGDNPGSCSTPPTFTAGSHHTANVNYKDVDDIGPSEINLCQFTNLRIVYSAWHLAQTYQVATSNHNFSTSSVGC